MDLPSLLTALTVTVMAYCAFPLIFAAARKQQISAKKYRVFCYLFNFLIMLFFVVIGGGSSGAPYFIWTSLFCAFGLKILGKKELVLDPDSQVTEYESNSEASAVSVQSTTKKSKDRFCKYCGSPIDPETKKCIGCGKQYFRLPKITPGKLRKPAVVLLCIAFLTALGYIGYLNETNTQLQNEISVLKSQNSVMENDVAELNEILRSQNRELEALNMDVARKNAEINRLTPKAENYQEICSKMKIGNIGYASSNFHSDKSIIVVQKALWLQDGITLTANWPQGGTVNVSYSSDCARFSFTEDSWYQTTKLKVYPKSLGVTVATFSNSVNKETFKVLIIVID